MKRAEEIREIINDEFRGTLFLEEETVPIMHAANFLENAEIGKEVIPYNVLIESSDYYEGKEYLFCFLSAIKKLFPDKRVGLIDGEELLEKLSASDNTINNYSVIGIEAVFENPETSQQELFTQWLKSTPEIIKIVCIGGTDADNWLKSNEDIYYRLLPHQNHTELHPAGPENIYAALIRMLEEKEYMLTDSFRDQIEQYILDVYPNADLRKEEFIKDLYERIIRNLWNKGIEDISKIDEDCVPLYHKNRPVKTENVDYDTAALLCNRVWDKTGNADWINEQGEYNILLMSLSTFGAGNTVWRYQDGDKQDQYEYFYQLEPVPQIIQRELGLKRIDRIILLCTSAVQDENKARLVRIGGTAPCKLTEAQYFKKRFCEWAGLNPETQDDMFHIINIDEQDPTEGVSETVKYIRKIKDENKKTRLYIDEHGGLRGLQYIFEAIISLMKNEIEIAAIYTAVTDVKQHTSKIIKNDATIDMYDFVSGINEFINYGRIDSLEKYYKKEEEVLENHVVGIKDISEGLQLCNTHAFEDGIEKVKQWVNIDSSEAQQIEGKKKYLELFKKSIKDDYGELLKEGGYDILDLVHWCTKKGFIQQALTYIEDRMPGEYYVDKLIRFDWEYKNKSQAGLPDDEEHRERSLRKSVTNQWYQDQKSVLFYSGIRNVSTMRKKQFLSGLIRNNLSLNEAPSSAWTKDDEKIEVLNCGILYELWKIRGYKLQTLLRYYYEIKKAGERAGKQPPLICSMLSENYYNNIIISSKALTNAKKLNGMLAFQDAEGLAAIKIDDYVDKSEDVNEKDQANLKAFLTCLKGLCSSNYLEIGEKDTVAVAKLNLKVLEYIISESDWKDIKDSIADVLSEKLIPDSKDKIKGKKLKLFLLLLNSGLLPEGVKEIDAETIRRAIMDTIAEPDSVKEIIQQLSYTGDDTEKLFDEKFVSDDISEADVRKGYIEYRIKEANVEKTGKYVPNTLSDEVYDYYREKLGFGSNCSISTWAGIEDNCSLRLGDYSINISIPEEIDRASLQEQLLLHAALKQERNNCNHASDKGKRVPTKVVQQMLYDYIEMCRTTRQKLQ